VDEFISKLRKEDLMRRFVLDVTADGTVFIRDKSLGKPCPYGGLPVFSTETQEQAEAIQIRYCRRANDGSGHYRLNEFDGNLGSLATVTTLFRAEYERAAKP
jgi:hypothetical protein